MVRLSILKNPIYSIFVEIKQSLILDPDLDQLENWAHNQKSKYITDSAYQRTPRIHFLLKIKLSLTLDPLDLNVDQFKNRTKN